MKYALAISLMTPLIFSYPIHADDDDNSDSEMTFKGNPCTVDCAGHEAGYEWAKQHDITDPDDCGGKSQSFIEGCVSYAEEQQNGADNDDN